MDIKMMANKMKVNFLTARHSTRYSIAQHIKQACMLNQILDNTPTAIGNIIYDSACNLYAMVSIIQFILYYNNHSWTLFYTHLNISKKKVSKYF